MELTARTRAVRNRRRVLLTTVAMAISGCSPREPLLSFLDEESSLSFTHPPRWSLGFAQQGGIRYRYLTAPVLVSDKEALSVTLISPTVAESADAVSLAYLSGGSGVVAVPAPKDSTEWSFKDSSGVSSRLRVTSAGGDVYFGAWVRGSDAAMKDYAARLDTLLGSLRLEKASQWPEERFAGMAARVPSTWTRGSRFSSPTNATMQFKSLPLWVDKGTETIHGFVAVSKEPVPARGDLEAYARLLKDRVSDTVAVMEHQPWPADRALGRPAGSMDFMRSGTTLTATRVRRWITVKNGVGLMFFCESRADAFDRLDPWCRRMAETIHFE